MNEFPWLELSGLNTGTLMPRGSDIAPSMTHTDHLCLCFRVLVDPSLWRAPQPWTCVFVGIPGGVMTG